MSYSFINRDEKDWPNPRLKVGAIVGHTTTSTCRIWFRTGQPSKDTDFMILYYEVIREKPESPHINKFNTPHFYLSRHPEVFKKTFKVVDYNKDTTEVVEISEGLKPNREYCYALYGSDPVSGMRRVLLGQERPHTFKTMPDGKNDPYSFALYSCHMPYKEGWFDTVQLSENKHMWTHFDETLKRHKDKDLRFIIGGGDQIYSDGIGTPKINIIARLNEAARKEGTKLLPSEEEMVLWYRDLYRGYWGFGEVRKVFSSFPIYMMWDDHEIWDGWGSYKLKKGKGNQIGKMFPFSKDQGDLTSDDVEPSQMEIRGLKEEDLYTIKDRMFDAARQVYKEYQDSHNPQGNTEGLDYEFKICEDSSAFYFLDGRGERDADRQGGMHILGEKQMLRFEAWLASLDPEETKLVFVVSAVPVVHLTSLMADMADTWIAGISGLHDDLRDSWENELHDAERARLMKALFKAANRGQKVVILSGDVHMAAAFKIQDNNGKIIHQLTSSAITYNLPLMESYLFAKFGVSDDGTTKEGYKFKRLAMYGESNYSVVKVNPNNGDAKIEFQLYGEQEALAPRDLPTSSYRESFKKHEGRFRETLAMTHSIAKIPLDFDNF